jgi:hypothetical protein
MRCTICPSTCTTKAAGIRLGGRIEDAPQLIASSRGGLRAYLGRRPTCRAGRVSLLGTVREQLGPLSGLPESVAQNPLAESYYFPMQLLSLLRFLREQYPTSPKPPNLGRQLGEAPVDCIESVLLPSRHAKT